MMLKRVSLVLIGLLLIALVTFLGLKSLSKPSFVVWFGLAAAFAAPVSLIAIGSAFNPSQNETIKQLAKVPQVEELIQKAKSEEEKVRLLKKEREQLSELIRFESLRLSLLARKDLLEKEGSQLVKALNEIEADLRLLEIQVQESDLFSQIDELRERLRLKDRDSFVFYVMGRRIAVDAGGLRSNPLGEIVLGYIIIFRELIRLFNRLFTRPL